MFQLQSLPWLPTSLRIKPRLLKVTFEVPTLWPLPTPPASSLTPALLTFSFLHVLCSPEPEPLSTLLPLPGTPVPWVRTTLASLFPKCISCTRSQHGANTARQCFMDGKASQLWLRRGWRCWPCYGTPERCPWGPLGLMSCVSETRPARKLECGHVDEVPWCPSR